MPGAPGRLSITHLVDRLDDLRTRRIEPKFLELSCLKANDVFDPIVVTFDPPTLRQELSKALKVISEKAGDLYTLADFGDLIDVNGPAFDPEELEDAVITPDTLVSFSPPGATTTFDISYRDVIAMLNDACRAKIDSEWSLCLTPRSALLPVVARSAESSALADKLAARQTMVEQEAEGGVIRVQLVSGLTVFGLCVALDENYSDDYFPSVSKEHLFIEVSRPYSLRADSSGQLEMLISAEEARAFAAAFLYELNLALDMELDEVSLRFNEEYADEKAVEEKMQTFELRPLLTGPGMGDVLRHYNDGVRAHSAADGVLSFTKVFEYVSATVVRERLIDRARQKLLSSRARVPDSAYILELQELFEAEGANRKDRVAVILTTRTCCDADELRHLSPECCKKLREMAANASDKEREAALENFAECIVSTRNMLSHAKANFDPTGFECPRNQLDQLSRCLRVAAQQVIHYFHGVHPNKRVL